MRDGLKQIVEKVEQRHKNVPPLGQYTGAYSNSIFLSNSCGLNAAALAENKSYIMNAFNAENNQKFINQNINNNQTIKTKPPTSVAAAASHQLPTNSLNNSINQNNKHMKCLLLKNSNIPTLRTTLNQNKNDPKPKNKSKVISDGSSSFGGNTIPIKLNIIKDSSCLSRLIQDNEKSTRKLSIHLSGHESNDELDCGIDESNSIATNASSVYIKDKSVGGNGSGHVTSSSSSHYSDLFTR